MEVQPLSTAPAADLPDLKLRWLFGQTLGVRDAAQDVMTAVPTYVVASLLLIFGAARDVLPTWVAAGLITYFVLCWGTIFALVRTGWSQGLDDPKLTLPRVLIDMSAITLTYGLIPMIRGSTLQLVCAMLAFYMGRLNQRQILATSLVAVGLLLSTLASLWHFSPQDIVMEVEILNVAMCSILLPIAAFVGGEVYRLYQRASRQRDELQLTLTQLQHLSTRDGLTDLANRGHMLTLLDAEIRRQHRHGQAFSMALLDIDFFKQVNDTHGHPIGDQVLKTFARLASEALGPTDTLSRWGGEEFLLLMPAKNLPQALHTLQQLHAVIREHDWAKYAPGLTLTFSAGAVEHVQQEPLESVLERVDHAMYRAKQQGRDRSEVAAAYDAVAMRHHVPLSAAPARATAAPMQHAEAPSVPAGDATRDASSTTMQAGWMKRLSHLAMGRNASMRDRTRVMLAAMLGFAFWIATLHFYAIPQQLVPPYIGHIMMAYLGISVVACYGLIRSGVTVRWRDPQMALLQIVNVSCITMLCYLKAPALRAVILQSMCVILIFGMVSLRPRHTRWVGGLSIVLMLAALAAQYVSPHPEVNMTHEIMKAAVACFVFFHITTYSHAASQLRADITREHGALTQAVHKVHKLMAHDALTGLFNRSHLMTLLENERQRFALSQRRFCLAMIDLDHFKQINDSHGHHVGDEVLIEFGQLARTVLRDTDVIGRWGGEEFLIILPDTEPGPQGLIGLERLRERFAQHTLARHQNLNLTLSLSCGVAEFRLDENVEQTLQRADRALYAAKAAGRNRCVLDE